MENQLAFLNYEYWGNKVSDYLLAVGFFVLGIIILFIFQKMALSRFRKWTESTKWPYDDFMYGLFEKTLIPLVYLGAFYFSVNLLTLNDAVEKLVQTFCVIILTFQVSRFILSLIVLLMQKGWFGKDIRTINSTASKGIITIVRIVVWGIAVVFLLDNLGFNISAVVAGLGIGGVAIAFAAQHILGDLFNYFVIFFDKPFEEGDFIIVDNYLGVIEHVGIKTTRLRSLSGEQVVMANSDLTGSRIRNYKRMEKRRVLFKVGVVYQTTLAQLKKIPGIIKGIVEAIPDTIFDRAHFQGFGDSSLDVEVVYYVLSSDYNKYMDIQQEINLKLVEVFAKEQIDFAYPTRTLYLNQVSG